jgi:hypothetical protein
MGEHVAGTIQVKVCASEEMTNDWLTTNADLEVIDIKYTGTDENDNFMIIYRKED